MVTSVVHVMQYCGTTSPHSWDEEAKNVLAVMLRKEQGEPLGSLSTVHHVGILVQRLLAMIVVTDPNTNRCTFTNNMISRSPAESWSQSIGTLRLEDATAISDEATEDPIVLLLADIEKAHPSVSEKEFVDVIQTLGIPRPATNNIKGLIEQATYHIKFFERLSWSFTITRAFTGGSSAAPVEFKSDYSRGSWRTAKRDVKPTVQMASKLACWAMKR